MAPWFKRLESCRRLFVNPFSVRLRVVARRERVERARPGTSLKIIDAYKNESTVPASKEPADLLRAGVPIAMRTIGEMIETYERGELGTTAQKQLMSTMRKLVKKYG